MAHVGHAEPPQGCTPCVVATLRAPAGEMFYEVRRGWGSAPVEPGGDGYGITANARRRWVRYTRK